MARRPQPTSWCSNSRINTFNHSSTACNRSQLLRIPLSVGWDVAYTQFSSSNSNRISCSPILPQLRSWDPRLIMLPKLALSSSEALTHFTTALLMDSRSVRSGRLSPRLKPMFSNLVLILYPVINSSSFIKEGSSTKILFLTLQMMITFTWDIKLLKSRISSQNRQRPPA